MTDGLLLPPGGGRKIQTMTLKAGAEQSKIWSAFEAEVAPGFDVGAHLHHQAEEVFYVLEGELDLLAAPEGDLPPLRRPAVRHPGHRRRAEPPGRPQPHRQALVWACRRPDPGQPRLRRGHRPRRRLRRGHPRGPDRPAYLAARRLDRRRARRPADPARRQQQRLRPHREDHLSRLRPQVHRHFRDRPQPHLPLLHLLLPRPLRHPRLRRRAAPRRRHRSRRPPRPRRLLHPGPRPHRRRRRPRPGPPPRRSR